MTDNSILGISKCFLLYTFDRKVAHTFSPCNMALGFVNFAMATMLMALVAFIAQGQSEKLTAKDIIDQNPNLTSSNDVVVSITNIRSYGKA